MKPNIFLKNLLAGIILTCIISFKVNGQITESNWLIGGTASFSFLNQSNTDPSLVKLKQTELNINPTVGYLIKNKLAVGLTPSITFSHVNNLKAYTTFSIGPFARYYFLSEENIINVFTEGSYAYNTSLGKNQAATSHIFSLSAGPVLFFNTSIGLEFPISYSFTKISGATGNGNKIKLGIGFKFYLGKKE